MALDLVAPIPALRQNFVAGLRFDQEVQYQVQTRSTKRWRHLPVKLQAQEDAPYAQAQGLRLGLMQCMAVVGLLTWRQVQQEIAPYMALPLHEGAFGEHQNACDFGAAYGLRLCATMDLHLQNQDSQRAWQSRIGQHVLSTLHAGAMCVVGFEHEASTSTRWACVVGVECLAHAAHDVCALLLLDGCGDEPWACGHNARLELQAGRECVCRHLSGKAFAAFPTRLICVHPK